MLLSEIFDYLTNGELSQLSIGGFGDGGISATDQGKVIAGINMGLIKLYERFPIRTRELVLQMYDGITLYTLTSDFAVSNTGSAEDPKYIIDTAEKPFEDDILKITNVFNEEAYEHALNDVEEEYSVYTPESNILQIPFAIADVTMSVIYRAKPIVIALDVADPTAVEVDIPFQLLDALTAFIAYKVFAPMNIGVEGGDTNSYLTLFETLCAQSVVYGMMPNDNTANLRFDDGGWK